MRKLLTPAEFDAACDDLHRQLAEAADHLNHDWLPNGAPEDREPGKVADARIAEARNALGRFNPRCEESRLLLAAEPTPAVSGGAADFPEMAARTSSVLAGVDHALHQPPFLGVRSVAPVRTAAGLALAILGEVITLRELSHT